MENFSLVHLVALVLSAALLAAGPAPSAPDAATIAVPITALSDHLYVMVRLDGSAPLRFALDTSGGEIVDAAVAQRLGLRLRGRVRVGGVGGGSEAARLATVGRVDVGGARLDGVRFLVLPVARSFGVAEGVRVDGVIGPELLARFRVTVDAAAGVLTLAPPGSGPLGDVPLALDADGHPAVPCTVAAVAARCQLDTGSRLALTLLRPFLAAHPAVAALATTADGVEGYGIGGAARGRLGAVDVTLAGRSVNVVGDFTSQRRGAFADDAADANAGEALLRRFVVTYDLRRGRARIEPSTAIDDAPPQDRSGLFAIRPDDVRTIVLDVRPGTPAAAAGVHASDELVALDGMPAAVLSLDAVRARLREPAGTRVELRLRADDGSERDVELTLADYVCTNAACVKPRGALGRLDNGLTEHALRGVVP